jgi:two-component system, LytTR family, response regulator
VTALRALVADDEPLARAGMARLVRATPGFEVAGEARDGDETIAAIAALRPDLVLLDVQMPGRDGFEVIRVVGPARMPQVIFVTAYDAFAVRAFEVQALDYLLKPFEDRRLREALSRAARASPVDWARRLEALVARPPSEPRFEVRLGKRIQLLPCAEIDWAEGASYYTVLHSGSGTHLVREPLRDIEARLDPARFARVHRSAIVQLDRVRELRPAERALVLRDGTRVQASRARWPRLLEALRGLA